MAVILNYKLILQSAAVGLWLMVMRSSCALEIDGLFVL